MLSFSIKFFIYECPMSLVTQTASAVMQPLIYIIMYKVCVSQATNAEGSNLRINKSNYDYTPNKKAS